MSILPPVNPWSSVLPDMLLVVLEDGRLIVQRDSHRLIFKSRSNVDMRTVLRELARPDSVESVYGEMDDSSRSFIDFVRSTVASKPNMLDPIFLQSDNKVDTLAAHPHLEAAISRLGSEINKPRQGQIHALYWWSSSSPKGVDVISEKEDSLEIFPITVIDGRIAVGPIIKGGCEEAMEKLVSAPRTDKIDCAITASFLSLGPSLPRLQPSQIWYGPSGQLPARVLAVPGRPCNTCGADHPSHSELLAAVGVSPRPLPKLPSSSPSWDLISTDGACEATRILLANLSDAAKRESAPSLMLIRTQGTGAPYDGYWVRYEAGVLTAICRKLSLPSSQKQTSVTVLWARPVEDSIKPPVWPKLEIGWLFHELKPSIEFPELDPPWCLAGGAQFTRDTAM